MTGAQCPALPAASLRVPSAQTHAEWRGTKRSRPLEGPDGHSPHTRGLRSLESRLQHEEARSVGGDMGTRLGQSPGKAGRREGHQLPEDPAGSLGLRHGRWTLRQHAGSVQCPEKPEESPGQGQRPDHSVSLGSRWPGKDQCPCPCVSAADSGPASPGLQRLCPPCHRQVPGGDGCDVGVSRALSWGRQCRWRAGDGRQDTSLHRTAHQSRHARSAAERAGCHGLK